MEGTATLVSNKEESERVLNMLKRKFPSMANIPLDSDDVVIKITPKICYFSNYIKRFGHRDKVEY